MTDLTIGAAAVAGLPMNGLDRPLAAGGLDALRQASGPLDRLGAAPSFVFAQADGAGYNYAKAAAPVSATKSAYVAEDLYKPSGEGRTLLTPHGSLHVASDAELRRYGLTNAMLQPNGSDFRARAYVDNNTQHLVIGFRGTETNAPGSAWSNLNADAWQNSGLATNFYNQAMQIAAAVTASGHGSEVTFTGHSLGGGMAAAASIVSGAHADTFEAAGLNSNTVRLANYVANGGSLQGPAHVGDVVNYEVPGDLLRSLPSGAAPWGAQREVPLLNENGTPAAHPDNAQLRRDIKTVLLAPVEPYPGFNGKVWADVQRAKDIHSDVRFIERGLAAVGR